MIPSGKVQPMVSVSLDILVPVRLKKPLLVLLLVGGAAAVIVPTLSWREPKEPASSWETLEPGLEIGVLPARTPSSSGDSKIRVLRIDPRRFELRLLNAS